MPGVHEFISHAVTQNQLCMTFCKNACFKSYGKLTYIQTWSWRKLICSRAFTIWTSLKQIQLNTWMWDATYASFHLDLAILQTGAVTEEVDQKKAKYAELTPTHAPFCLSHRRNHCRFWTWGLRFLFGLSCGIKNKPGKPLSHQYLLERISIAIQWGNTAAVLGTSLPIASACDSIYFQWLYFECRHICVPSLL